MAVVTTKSSAITNADATPPVLNNARVSRARILEAVGTLEAVNGDSIASIYRFCRVPSGARVSRVLISNDAITTCAGDVGLYQTVANGGAAVGANGAAFFGSAISLASAQVNIDVTHEADPTGGNAADFGLEDVEKPLWQCVGLTADPLVMYDVAVTLTAAAGSAGTVSLKVQYVEN
jgi:hypothetical protein